MGLIFRDARLGRKPRPRRSGEQAGEDGGIEMKNFLGCCIAAVLSWSDPVGDDAFRFPQQDISKMTCLVEFDFKDVNAPGEATQICIKPDGDLVANGKFNPDRLSREFWESISKNLPSFCGPDRGQLPSIVPERDNWRM